MARVGYDTPMMAYDHIASMLKDQAGPGGVVSRDEAEALVASLTKEGRGTEALAAKNIFKLIDARDHGEGNRVTGYDFKASRAYVRKEMLTDYDRNKNGWSAGEMARMSPTARALVELGQTLKIEKKGGRMAHSVPAKGMAHVAALINQADGGNKRISRDEAEALVATLNQQGRGTEALAVEFFFKFTDHRDAGQVTEKAIARAVEYSGTKLLTNKDANRNGYSAAEAAKFSTTAKAFALVGKMINAGIIKSAA